MVSPSRRQLERAARDAASRLTSEPRRLAAAAAGSAAATAAGGGVRRLISRDGEATDSSAYRLLPEEPIATGIRRVVTARVEDALAELRGETDSAPADAIHEARKDMKKLRALLRLARGELGERAFARENAVFRDAARELSGVRDADVMLETLQSLDLPAGLGWEVREKIQEHHALRREGGRETAARGVVGILTEARGRVEDWPLKRDSFGALAPGLERTYRRGRRDFRAAREEPSVECMHEWRKRVKELWYHHALLRCVWPPVMSSVGDEAHALSTLLGDDHDLAVLAAWVGEHVGEEPELAAAVERRRGAIRGGEAFALGERLYAEKPSAYVRRVKRLWHAGEAGVRAP